MGKSSLYSIYSLDLPGLTKCTFKILTMAQHDGEHFLLGF